MEYLPIVVEGIEHKIKKIIFSNHQLTENNQHLKQQNENLENKVRQLEKKISEQEDTIVKQRIAQAMVSRDKSQAKHQINEMLREIDKCYALLNR